MTLLRGERGCWSRRLTGEDWALWRSVGLLKGKLMGLSTCDTISLMISSAKRPRMVDLFDQGG